MAVAVAALARSHLSLEPPRSRRLPRLEWDVDLSLYPTSFESPATAEAFVALDIEAVAAKVRRIINKEDVAGITYSPLRTHTTREGGRERKFWSMDIVIPQEAYSDELADDLDDILAQEMEVEEIDMLLTWIISDQ